MEPSLPLSALQACFPINQCGAVSDGDVVWGRGVHGDEETIRQMRMSGIIQGAFVKHHLQTFSTRDDSAA